MNFKYWKYWNANASNIQNKYLIITFQYQISIRMTLARLNKEICSEGDWRTRVNHRGKTVRSFVLEFLSVYLLSVSSDNFIVYLADKWYRDIVIDNIRNKSADLNAKIAPLTDARKIQNLTFFWKNDFILILNKSRQ